MYSVQGSQPGRKGRKPHRGPWQAGEIDALVGIPSANIKKAGHLPVILKLVRKRQRTFWTCWPPFLTELGSSRLTERPCLKI